MIQALMVQCRVCGNEQGNKVHHAREMMFGYRDVFEYIECAGCGCVFLKDMPADMGRYYSPRYYSLGLNRLDPLKAFAGAFMLRHYLKSTPAGKAFGTLFDLTSFDWMRHVELRPGSSILDVGCGVGKLLLVMSRLGFTRLSGTDPFISADIFYKNGVTVWKKALGDLDGSYDFIMLHHSFEHMPEPLQALIELRRLIKSGGTVLIRTPVAQAHAWREYGVDWFQLDAPRHVFLQSVRSMHVLTEKAGLEIGRVDFDSTEQQFWGSEQYRHDIPLLDEKSYRTDQRRSIFTRKDIRMYRQKAFRLNNENDGDQACFVLYKK